MSVVVGYYRTPSEWAIAADTMYSPAGTPAIYQSKLIRARGVPGAFGVAGYLQVANLFSRLIAEGREGENIKDRLEAVYDTLIKHPLCTVQSGNIPNIGIDVVYCGPSGLFDLDRYGAAVEHTGLVPRSHAIGVGGLVALGYVFGASLDDSPHVICRRAAQAACAILPHQCGGQVEVVS